MLLGGLIGLLEVKPSSPECFIWLGIALSDGFIGSHVTDAM